MQKPQAYNTQVTCCAVNKQAQQTGQELLEQVASAERERAAAPDEVPLGEWEALRVRPDYGSTLTSQALLASSAEAQDLLQACSSCQTCPSGTPVSTPMPLFMLCASQVPLVAEPHAGCPCQPSVNAAALQGCK